METLVMVLNIALVVTAAIIIVVVAIQSGKNAGLGAAFGGESASATPRAKSASREIILQRITVVLGIIFAVLALACSIVAQFVK